jgi:hypothetical protein
MTEEKLLDFTNSEKMMKLSEDELYERLRLVILGNYTVAQKMKTAVDDIGTRKHRLSKVEQLLLKLNDYQWGIVWYDTYLRWKLEPKEGE